MEELVELGPGSEVGRGLPLSRDSHGVIVSDSPKSPRLRQGDRVLAARVSFEGATPEAVWRALEGAGACRVSLHLRRATPGDTAGDTEGQRDRMPLPTPAASKKPPAPPAAPLAPVSVELALPKLPKLPKPLLAPSSPTPEPPRPPRPRLTVREAAAARTPLPEPPKPPEPPGEPLARIPAVEVAAPKGSLGLSPPQIHLGKGGPTPGDEEGAARGGFRVPSVPIDVPTPSVELGGIASPEPPSARPASFTEGLRRLSRELEPPAVEIAPKTPKFRLPRLGWALGKLSASPPPSPPVPSVGLDLGAKLKVPKLSLVPFGDTEDGPRFGLGSAGSSRFGFGSAGSPRFGSPGSPRFGSAGSSRFGFGSVGSPRFGFGSPGSPRFGIAAAALPKFGGSSPDLRPGGVPKSPPKRGGSAESLILGWTAPEPTQTRPKARISIPAVGFALPGPGSGSGSGPGRPKSPEPLKVPELELAPPGLDGTSDPSGRRFGVKLPKFGAGSVGRMRRGSSKGAPEGDGNPRRRRWVPRVGFTPSPEPPKLGRIRFPEVELCPGDPQISGLGGIPSRCDPGEGTPKFQLPQLVLSPQICGEP